MDVATMILVHAESLNDVGTDEVTWADAIAYGSLSCDIFWGFLNYLSIR